MRGGRRSALAGLAVAAVLGACGVEVPDDVAVDVDRSTDASGPSTTEPPTSDDPLEQALIDNGYTLDEARCAAENLREELDEDEIDDIVEADSLEDISVSSADEFADAVQPCIEDGAPVEDPEPDDPRVPADPDDPGDPDDGGRPRVPRRPGQGGR